MEELRDKIANLIGAGMYLRDVKIAGSIADNILALPEIAEALAFTDKFKAGGFNVSGAADWTDNPHSTDNL